MSKKVLHHNVMYYNYENRDKEENIGNRYDNVNLHLTSECERCRKYENFLLYTLLYTLSLQIIVQITYRIIFE